MLEALLPECDAQWAMEKWRLDEANTKFNAYLYYSDTGWASDGVM